MLKLTKTVRRKNKVGKTYRKRWGGVKSLDRVVRKDLTEKVTCEQNMKKGRERERKREGRLFQIQGTAF